MSYGGDVLGYPSVAMHPDGAGNISAIPAFMSEGSTIATGWVIPSEPVAIYWENYAGAPCRTGTPHIKSKTTMKVHGVAYWQPGTNNLYAIDGYTPLSGVFISSISDEGGGCSYPNAARSDLVPLDPTPIDSYSINTSFPWTISPL